MMLVSDLGELLNRLQERPAPVEIGTFHLPRGGREPHCQRRHHGDSAVIERLRPRRDAGRTVLEPGQRPTDDGQLLLSERIEHRAEPSELVGYRLDRQLAIEPKGHRVASHGLSVLVAYDNAVDHMYAFVLLDADPGAERRREGDLAGTRGFSGSSDRCGIEADHEPDGTAAGRDRIGGRALCRLPSSTRLPAT